MIEDASPGNADLLQKIQSLATNAAKPEVSEPGPGDVQPTNETKVSPLVTLPMTEDEVKAWWERVKLYDQRADHESKAWDTLLKEYLPIVKESGEAETIKIPKHFRNVHSKIGQLFYKTPEPVLLPKDPSPAQDQQPNPMDPLGLLGLPPIRREDIISVKQAVLTDKLGRDNINYSRLMDELLFDVLAWAGRGCSKIGYRCVLKPIQEPVMVDGPAPPPMEMPGSVLGLGGPPVGPPPQIPLMGPDGKPVTRTVQVPVFEEFYERRFSPKKLIHNADLTSTRFDQDATMMGMHFYISRKSAKVYGLTEEEEAKGAEDDKRYKHEGDPTPTQKSDLLHGVELWVKASHFTDEVHPQAINQLILIEGLKRPVVWRPSPDQSFDAKGRLTQDSMVGFPIKVLTIRDLADSAFPPADSAFTNSEIKQLTTFMRQSVERRDVAIGHYLYDSGKFDDDQLILLKSGKPGRYVPVEEGGMAQGADKVLTLAAQVHATADDYRTHEIFGQSIDETLGIGRVQAGAPEDTVRTATEIANIQSAIAGRNGKELSRAVDFFLDSVRKLDQLLMRYATEEETTYIAGDEGAMRLMVWNNKLISGRYLYDISPDSQLQVDTARERKATLDYYQLTAADPFSNRVYVLRRLARMYGMDPMKAVIQPPPMLPGMPPPGAPGSEGSPQPSGQPGAPSTISLTPGVQPPPGGGPGTPGAPLNVHQLTKTGGRQNEPGAEPRR